MGDVLATVLAYLEGQAPTTKSSGVVNSDLRRAIAAFLAGHDLTADLLAFVLRCSAENPASIGKKQSEAVTLLERHGIKPREYGLFFHSEEADVEDAAALLSSFLEAPLSEAEKKAQAVRCACRGSDDYCPCQNTPDRETRRVRILLAEGCRDAEQRQPGGDR